MRRHRRDNRWIYRATTSTVVASLVVLFATMVLTVQSSQDDLLDESIPVPEFLPGVVNVTARQGDVVILPCAVRYLGTKQVAWRRIEEDKFLTIGTMTWAADSNVSMDHSRKAGHVTNWNLIIQHVKPEDSGIYECQVTSRAGQVRHIQLNVVGPPITKPDSSQLSRPEHPQPGNNVPNVPVSVCGMAYLGGCLISITGKKYVDLGEKIQLLCNASGGLIIPDEIDWFKEGNKIDSTKYRHVLVDKQQSMTERSFTSQLTIEQSTLADTGDYICRSSRNDIANLKVTVLYAESANKRRGTGPGQNQARNPDYDNRAEYPNRIRETDAGSSVGRKEDNSNKGHQLSVSPTFLTLVTAILTLLSYDFSHYL